jgi:hypothetical protein
MWGHHLLSLLIWPYALLRSRLSVFAVYFMATELTNIGQNIFWLASKGGLAPGLAAPLGLLWLLSFLLVRILPLPWLSYAYLDGLWLRAGCGLTAAEWTVSVCAPPAHHRRGRGMAAGAK